MDLKQFKLVGGDLYSLGLVDSHGGSLSVREGNTIHITRKGAMLGHLEESDILAIPLDPTEGAGDASLELPVHRAIYKETAFKAVICARPPYAIALSSTAENKLLLQDQEAQSILKSIPIVRAKARPNTDEVAKLLPAIYKSGYVACIVRDFGSFTVGEDLLEALKYATCLENSCKSFAISKPVSAPPAYKPKEPDRVRRSAIPPGIGVMGRASSFKRGMGRH